ncbi:MAG TPA: helix-turn-helix transcriptional regulator [Sphingomicrobium sp.]|nr:helix-turn-helix transcriptional regulator [Sphingomicrobium sp.]
MAWTVVDSRRVLSAREQQILEMIAAGLSAKEVADQIGIAPRTVDRHVEHIRLKLCARNRVHMITQAMLDGVLDLNIAGDTYVAPSPMVQPSAKRAHWQVPRHRPSRIG